ncbi:hypothetical protein BGX34_009628 [Mortierella sp. NVP85]|nr:hypothetical protein BGX34_009628 [Mortierella sp. NVP85]
MSNPLELPSPVVTVRATRASYIPANDRLKRQFHAMFEEQYCVVIWEPKKIALTDIQRRDFIRVQVGSIVAIEGKWSTRMYVKDKKSIGYKVSFFVTGCRITGQVANGDDLPTYDLPVEEEYMNRDGPEEVLLKVLQNSKEMRTLEQRAKSSGISLECWESIKRRRTDDRQDSSTSGSSGSGQAEGSQRAEGSQQGQRRPRSATEETEEEKLVRRRRSRRDHGDKGKGKSAGDDGDDDDDDGDGEGGFYSRLSSRALRSLSADDQRRAEEKRVQEEVDRELAKTLQEDEENVRSKGRRSQSSEFDIRALQSGSEGPPDSSKVSEAGKDQSASATSSGQDGVMGKLVSSLASIASTSIVSAGQSQTQSSGAPSGTPGALPDRTQSTSKTQKPPSAEQAPSFAQRMRGGFTSSEVSGKGTKVTFDDTGSASTTPVSAQKARASKSETKSDAVAAPPSARANNNARPANTGPGATLGHGNIQVGSPSRTGTQSVNSSLPKDEDTEMTQAPPG